MDAVLPAGTSVTITPPQGGVVTVSNIIEGSQVTNLDGSVTVVFSPDLIEASAQIVCTGFGTASLVGFVPGLTPPIFSMYQTVV